ncbi:MAG: hypothetical protein PHT78_06810 [Desulfitobacteriaceae bacterium]|nr:hypothetical protein [Desulfitobacteriaceae bacterium]MDD4752947.1 hypothetical protein [Desulfitobacteriaceae bacterium]
MKKIKMTLCQKNCCPNIEFNKDTNSIIIKDDFGGKVTLTAEQFKMLLNHYLKNKGD